VNRIEPAYGIQIDTTYNPVVTITCPAGSLDIYSAAAAAALAVIKAMAKTKTAATQAQQGLPHETGGES
jgi:hypothetical protein